MEALRDPSLPRRISRLYADTKRSYEHVVRNNDMTQRLSGTHIKLRIQKDRLIAWGLEWADVNSPNREDIDCSLDQAGISDLVASIMSSIRQLLEEADRIHLQRNASFPAVLADDKGVSLTGKGHLKTSTDLSRLDDIVKDLTASVDILCDLSKLRHGVEYAEISRLPNNSPDITSETKEASPSPKSQLCEKPSASHVSAQMNLDELISAACIQYSQLEILYNDVIQTSTSSPPSYESVAASSEDRVLAYSKNPLKHNVPLLLDYLPALDSAWAEGKLPSASRYSDLLRAQRSSSANGCVYNGVLNLTGWVEDPQRSRTALTYAIPPFAFGEVTQHTESFQAQSLLSYLQHAADTDSLNMPNLEDRFRLALNLVSTVLHLHAKGLLHRNVNSNNILFFIRDPALSSMSKKPWKRGVIRRPFLTSFDQLSNDVDDEREEPFIANIYRHPKVERGQRSTFSEDHDIYSLGLVLLEIGLWMPISKLWKTRYTRADFKARLQTIYTRKLSAKCGSCYARVVENCLRAADEPQFSQRSLQQTFDGSKQSSRAQTGFYWSVFKPLERCCMIDEMEGISAVPHNRFSSTISEIPEIATQDDEQGAGPKDGSIMSNLPDLNPVDNVKERPEESPIRPREKKKTKCKVWSYDIPAVVEAHWNQNVFPKLNRIFGQVIDRWESCSIDLFMAGETAEAARPTIYMVCNSVEKARKVLEYVNRDRGLFDIKVARGQIMRSKSSKKRKPTKKKQSSKPSVATETLGETDDFQTHLSHYQERPTCGASIGAYCDEEHLPPVSFGGTVLVDGEPYGMSVHHMLDNDEIDIGLDDSFDVHRSMFQRPRAWGDKEDQISGDWKSESPPEAPFPLDMSDDEDEGFQDPDYQHNETTFDPALWDNELVDVDMGDSPGIELGCGDDLIVTQPAIDDVSEGFFPNEEDMAEDHLSSHTLGHIHASSGIKRTSHGTTSHEVDWALIKVRENRSYNANLVKGGKTHCAATPRTQISQGLLYERDSYPYGVVGAEKLGGLKVHSIGRTSGLQTGFITPRMVKVMMPGRISFSDSWQVEGDFGVGGDSGAWVIDNASGRVCAHILARSQKKKVAYIAPMELLLDDIAEKLNAKVSFPGEQNVQQQRDYPKMVTSSIVKEESPDTLADGFSQLSTSDIRRSMASKSPKPTGLPNTTPVPTSSLRLSSGSSVYSLHSKCLESKRRSGSEMLLEKGEGGMKAGCRLSMG
ncbi:MAG: hypothetical protein LQ351_002845 [Letrouitia transgressa]|nr:MAG: hypothetical protein LQ351_002845 [Letrouitia transgressa]